MSCTNLLDLPEECISHILSLTSPGDVVRSSAVSKQFLSASESDNVWGKFLPSDCDHYISQSSTPLDQQHFASKKDLFFYLCHSPLLFNNSTQSFALDKRSGKKCYMLGARMLMIAWGDNPGYWNWISIPESRFPEAAQLDSVCWLDIKGRLPIKILSSNTTYGAYFVFQKNIPSFYGFDEPVKACVIEVDEQGLPQNDVVKHCYLKAPEDDIDESEDDIVGEEPELHDPEEPEDYIVGEEPEDERSSTSPKELPLKRGDGWIEVEMGRYQVGFGVEGADERAVLEMTLKEVEELNWKSGILVQGIELRPLD